jgi:hypothetical protein
MSTEVFPEPRRAQIKEQKFLQYGDKLFAMGLKAREFRAVGKTDGSAVVYHEDSKLPPGKLTLNLDIIEFLPES